MSRWMVYKIAGIWQARDPEIDRTKIFFDWEDALHYANSKANTVEVILPRTPNHTTGTMTTHECGDGIRLTLKTPGAPIQVRITRHELKPLALALLAVSYTHLRAHET